MRYSRPARIILGILILAVFAWYTHLRLTDCVMSEDVEQYKPNAAQSAFSSMTPEEQEQAISMLRAANRNSGKDSIDVTKLLISDNSPVGIELDKALENPGSDYDPVLRHGDRIVVPEYSNTVTVNGEVVTEMGHKVMPTDEVRYGDKVLQREKPVYVLLNKPKDYITTTDDERDRANVMQLVRDACEERIYPVGRLDRDTTGLLLFTNDGDLTKKLTHPSSQIEKTYYVELDRNLATIDMAALRNGLELNDGVIIPDEVEYVGESRQEVGVTIHSGKNRIVRRMFEFLGYEVVKLDRVVFAGLTKKDLPRGRWRFLTKKEVAFLKMLSKNPQKPEIQ